MFITKYKDWVKAIKEAKKYLNEGGILSYNGHIAKKMIKRLHLQYEKNTLKVASETWKLYKQRYGLD